MTIVSEHPPVGRPRAKPDRRVQGMQAFTLVAAGLLLGVVAANHRQRFLFALAALLAVIAVAVAGNARNLPSGPLSIGAGSALFGAALVLLTLLARALPRLFVLLLLAMAAVASAPLGEARPRALLIAVGAAALIAAIALTIKADLGMRVACALLGARVALLAAPPHAPFWIYPVALLLVMLSAVTRRREPLPPVPWRRVARGALLLGALGAGAVLLSLPLSRELPASVAPFTSRQARLRGKAPAGGLVWPLPSETIGWDDDVRGEFARFPNFDSAWLGGEPSGLWRLPGTTLYGRLSLFRDVIDLRELKDEVELQALRAAALASVGAVREALPLYRAGVPEAQIADAIRAAHLRAGCSGESFPPIAASGPSAAEPHGSGNRGTVQAGQLVLTDVGCLVRGYASDFTRTLPVSGRFTERQRKLYDAVFAAQQAALAACKAGAQLTGRGDPKSLDSIARRTIKERGYDDNNPFGVGHGVGLFVHDMRAPGPLKAGMVVTIEPGLYVPGELGIRIEDTYLVTATGCEPLTTGFPADAASVEAAMQAAVAARH